MNVIWIVSDSFRKDHVGAYGNPYIRTPSLDALAAASVRFDAHYSAGFRPCPHGRTITQVDGRCPLWVGSHFRRA